MNEELALRIQAGENLYAELWERVRWFVRKQATAYRRYFPDSIIDVDDLVQGGYLALVDAVGAYDPAAGGTLLNLLSFHLKKVWREMYGLRGRREFLDTAISLDAPLDDDGDTTRLDLLPDERAAQAFEAADDDLFREQLRALLEKALDEAPHGDIVRRRYFQGQRAKQIAAALGISAARVGQCEAACKRHIRNGPYAKELQSFDFYGGTGLQAWKHSGSSVEERYLLFMEQYNERKKTNGKTEKDFD